MEHSSFTQVLLTSCNLCPERALEYPELKWVTGKQRPRKRGGGRGLEENSLSLNDFTGGLFLIFLFYIYFMLRFFCIFIIILQYGMF